MHRQLNNEPSSVNESQAIANFEEESQISTPVWMWIEMYNSVYIETFKAIKTTVYEKVIDQMTDMSQRSLRITRKQTRILKLEKEEQDHHL